MAAIANQSIGTPEAQAPGVPEYMLFDDDVNLETKIPSDFKKTFTNITGNTKLKRR